VTGRRWLLVAALGAAALFALMGGEYSTPAWLSLRRAEALERARIAELEREIDSLARVARLVATDPRTQERIARERHGMLRPGEHAFILEERERPVEADP
jgi:cell division protein FtsB